MIVAIARELGAGGRAVGEAVASALSVELLDNQIVDLVAQRLGAPESYVAERDEQVESFAERLLRGITAAYPESQRRASRSSSSDAARRSCSRTAQMWCASL